MGEFVDTNLRRYAARVAAPASAVFDLLADLPEYGRWLPGSEAFGGTRDVHPYPVELGTSYLDYGPAGERPGTVTVFEPPQRLGFEQGMLLRNWPLVAEIEVRILYLLAEEQGSTLVTRDLWLTVRTSGWRRLFVPLIRHKFAAENRRMMAVLERHAFPPRELP